MKREDPCKEFDIETKAGKLYANGAKSPFISYVEIGYYDEDGNAVPIAALEVKTKEIGDDVDENAIWRLIYNLKDCHEYDVEKVNSREKEVGHEG